MSEVNYSIREFTEEDLEGVVEINMACLPEHYPNFFYLSLHEDFSQSFLVAEDSKGIIQGYIMCRAESGFSSFGLLKGMARKGHVISIAVRPESRKNGVGKRLMEGAMTALRDFLGCDECYLEVRTSNKEAVSFYKGLSFAVLRKNSKYYQDGESAFTMGIKLVLGS